MFCFLFPNPVQNFCSEITNMFPIPISNVFFLRIEATGSGHHNARNDQPTSASQKEDEHVRKHGSRSSSTPQPSSLKEYRCACSWAWTSRLGTSSLATVTATRCRRSIVPVHGATCTNSVRTWHSSTFRFAGVHLRPRRQKKSCCPLRPVRRAALRHLGFSSLLRVHLFPVLQFRSFFRLL